MDRPARVEVVVSDLSQPRLGVSDSDWSRLVTSVDVVIHTGALVSCLELSSFVCAHLSDTGSLGIPVLTFARSECALNAGDR